MMVCTYVISKHWSLGLTITECLKRTNHNLPASTFYFSNKPCLLKLTSLLVRDQARLRRFFIRETPSISYLSSVSNVLMLSSPLSDPQPGKFFGNPWFLKKSIIPYNFLCYVLLSNKLCPPADILSQDKDRTFNKDDINPCLYTHMVSAFPETQGMILTNSRNGLTIYKALTADKKVIEEFKFRDFISLRTFRTRHSCHHPGSHSGNKKLHVFLEPVVLKRMSTSQK